MNTSLSARQVAPDVCVAPQLTPDAMAEAARAGFRSVVNNRPDFEHGPDQPTNSSIEAAACAAGLEYRFSQRWTLATAFEPVVQSCGTAASLAGVTSRYQFGLDLNWQMGIR